MKTIARADRRRLVGAGLLGALYGGWLYLGDSPLNRARDKMGSLPEHSFGVDLSEPSASLARLGAARGDYLWAQIFELPLAALIALFATFSFSLAALRTMTPIAAARPFLMLPLAYLAAEFGENILLALFAAGMAPAAAPLSVIQQVLTDLKLILMTIMLFLAASVTAAVGEARQEVRR